MNDYLHVVCLDAPSPPDYGGAIDMFYKIIALAESGKKIILHYYDYKGSRGVNGLEPYCAEINKYQRKGISSLSLNIPYIISSRKNQKLTDRLNADQHPILLEGLHCSGLIPAIRGKERIVLRMHNEEAEYYKRLASSETKPWLKLYYGFESYLLKKFYRKLSGYAVKYACLSTIDMEKFKESGLNGLNFVPCFIPWKTLNNRTGKGDYCLYHGNMKISENEKAAEWLIDIFRDLDIVLVIAGSGLSPNLKRKAAGSRNVRLINNPSMEELDAIIHDAHINVLPSLNATGVKLKLLHAVMEGRFCISNAHGAAGSGIAHLVSIAGDMDDFRKKILELWELPFTEEDKKNRSEALAVYDNIKNAKALSALW